MLLKGKDVAEKIVLDITSKGLPKLVLAVFHPVGDGSAESYLKAKEKWLEKAGFGIKIFPFDAETAPEKFFAELDIANNDPSIHAIMVETPLPRLVSQHDISSRLNPLKDIDGITYLNQGALYAGRGEGIVPCTSLASVRLLEAFNIKIAGKNAVVIGRSAVVGLPLFKLLLNRDATVLAAHSKTPDLAKQVGNADIIAVAVGRQGLISSSMVKEGASVIDIGINVGADGKLTGDFLIENETEKDRINYSPVPGGVGAVTNAIMLENLVKCYELQIKGA